MYWHCTDIVLILHCYQYQYHIDIFISYWNLIEIVINSRSCVLYLEYVFKYSVYQLLLNIAARMMHHWPQIIHNIADHRSYVMDPYTIAIQHRRRRILWIQQSACPTNITISRLSEFDCYIMIFIVVWTPWMVCSITSMFHGWCGHCYFLDAGACTEWQSMVCFRQTMIICTNQGRYHFFLSCISPWGGY